MPKKCVQYVLDDIARLLTTLSDEKYRLFSARLLPAETPLVGVRLPILRQIARQGVLNEGISFLNRLTDKTFEEKMMSGFVIGYVSLTITEKIPYIKNHLKKVDNWSLCDSFCATFCLSEIEKEELFPFLQDCLTSDLEYIVRFGIVMMLMYYTKQSDIDICLKLFETVKHKGYYVHMALAWAISTYYVLYPNKMNLYLQDNQLDKFVQNKAIQKIRESNNVPLSDKTFVLKYKKC